MKTLWEKSREEQNKILRDIQRKLDEAIQLALKTLNPVIIKVVIPKEDK